MGEEKVKMWFIQKFDTKKGKVQIAVDGKIHGAYYMELCKEAFGNDNACVTDQDKLIPHKQDDLLSPVNFQNKFLQKVFYKETEGSDGISWLHFDVNPHGKRENWWNRLTRIRKEGKLHSLYFVTSPLPGQNTESTLVPKRHSVQRGHNSDREQPANGTALHIMNRRRLNALRERYQRVRDF